MTLSDETKAVERYISAAAELVEPDMIGTEEGDRAQLEIAKMIQKEILHADQEINFIRRMNIFNDLVDAIKNK